MPYGVFLWLSLLLWSARFVLPASSLMTHCLPYVLSRLSVASSVTCSTLPSHPYSIPVSSLAVRQAFPSRPYRFRSQSRANRQTFLPRPCHFPASSRAIRPTFAFVCPVSCCVVRYSFGVSSFPSRLPFCPVSCFLRSPLFLFSPDTTIPDEQFCSLAVC